MSMRLLDESTEVSKLKDCVQKVLINNFSHIIKSGDETKLSNLKTLIE